LINTPPPEKEKEEKKEGEIKNVSSLSLSSPTRKHSAYDVEEKKK